MIAPNEEAPLQILPYFKFLNEYAQMSLMRQLIEKFQRTSITPRNYVMLPTPRLDMDRALPSTYEVDPNCFDAFSPRASGVSHQDNPSKESSVVDALETRPKQSESACVEAAISVALQVATGSASAEQILSLLLGISGGSGNASATGGVSQQHNEETSDKPTI